MVARAVGSDGIDVSPGIARLLPSKRFAEEIFGKVSLGIVCASRDTTTDGASEFLVLFSP